MRSKSFLASSLILFSSLVIAENDPWSEAFSLVSNVVSAQSEVIGSNAGDSYGGGYQVGDKDMKRNSFKGSAYASSNTSLTCDGVNFSTMYGNKMKSYPKVLEQLIQDAPTMAFMYIAYANPLIKGTIDELNQSFDSLFSLTGATCSNMEQAVKTKATDDAEAAASRKCISEEGSFSAECMVDKQNQMIDVWAEQKDSWSDSTNEYLDKIMSQIEALPGAGNSASQANTAAALELNCYDPNKIGPEDNVTEFIMLAGRYDCKSKATYGDLISKMSYEDVENNGTPKLYTEIQKTDVRTIYNDISNNISSRLKDILAVEITATNLQNTSDPSIRKARDSYQSLRELIGRSINGDVLFRLSNLSRSLRTPSDEVSIKNTEALAQKFKSSIATVSKVWAFEVVVTETSNLRAALVRGVSQISEKDTSFPIEEIDRALHLQLNSIDTEIQEIITSLELARVTNKWVSEVLGN